MKTFYSFPSLDFKEQRLIWEEARNESSEQSVPVIENTEVPLENATNVADANAQAIADAQTDILFLQRNIALVDETKHPDAKKQYQNQLDRVFKELNDLTNQNAVRSPTANIPTPNANEQASVENTTPANNSGSNNADKPTDADSSKTSNDKADETDEEKKSDESKKTEAKPNEGKQDENNTDDKETETTAEALEKAGVDAKTAQRIAEDTETALKDGKDSTNESNETIETREQLAKAVAQNPDALQVFQELHQRLQLGTVLSQKELLVGDALVTHIALYDKKMAKEKVDELRPKNPPETTEFINMVVDNTPKSSKENGQEQSKDTSQESIEDDKKRETRLYQEVRGNGKKENMKTVQSVLDKKMADLYEENAKQSPDPKKVENLNADMTMLKELEGKTKKLAKDSQDKISKLGYDLYEINNDISNQITSIKVDSDQSLGFKITIDKESKTLFDNAATLIMDPATRKYLDSAIKEGNPAVILSMTKAISEGVKRNNSEKSKK
jgi:hypothetical protein